jgi:hypothetical protein
MSVSDLRQVGGFLQVPPWYNWNIVESGHRQKKNKQKKADIKIKLIHKKN